MPLYDYKCQKCGHKVTKSSTIANRKQPCEAPCESCGETSVEQVLAFGGIADPVKLGRVKPPAGFNEVLRNIKNGNPGSTVNIRD